LIGNLLYGKICIARHAIQVLFENFEKLFFGGKISKNELLTTDYGKL